MDAEDKKPRVMKTTPTRARRRRLIKYTLIVVAIFAVVILVHLILDTVIQTPSKKLISTTSHLQNGKRPCSDGLKQIAPMASSLLKPGQYNTKAREAGLDYLMVCTLMSGNTKQALSYATQLNRLYAQNNQSQEQQKLAQFIKYMQSFDT